MILFFSHLFNFFVPHRFVNVSNKEGKTICVLLDNPAGEDLLSSTAFTYFTRSLLCPQAKPPCPIFTDAQHKNPLVMNGPESLYKISGSSLFI